MKLHVRPALVAAIIFAAVFWAWLIVAADSYEEIGFVEFGGGPGDKLTAAEAKEKGFL